MSFYADSYTKQMTPSSNISLPREHPTAKKTTEQMNLLKAELTTLKLSAKGSVFSQALNIAGKS